MLIRGDDVGHEHADAHAAKQEVGDSYLAGVVMVGQVGMAEQAD